MNRDADIIIHLWTPCVVRKTNVLYGCQSNSENKNRNESWWRSERSERPTRAIASEWTHENYFWKPWNKKEMRETESLVWKIFLVSEYFFMPHNFFVLLLFFWMGLFVLWKREWTRENVDTHNFNCCQSNKKTINLNSFVYSSHCL